MTQFYDIVDTTRKTNISLSIGMRDVVVTREESERHPCIAVKQQTKDGLDSIKRPGQSYDGVIQDLISFWNEKKRDYWTRKKEQKVAVVG